MKLSIVIAAWNGSAALRDCLASILDQIEPAEDQIIAVSNFDTGDVEHQVRSITSVRFVNLPPGTDVPQLRSCGIDLAQGEIVALLEDHCTVDRRWTSEIKKGHSLAKIVGGPVENQSLESRVSWAVYFYDYGKYMLPQSQGRVPSLSGNNVSYQRLVLGEIRDQYRNGFHETFINLELQRRGYSLYLMPSAIVYHKKTYRLKPAVIDSYHHGRLFGSRRVSQLASAIRAFRGVASLALVFVLPARIIFRTVRKRSRLFELWACLPYLLLLTTAWSCGEVCGSFFNEGASAGKWK